MDAKNMGNYIVGSDILGLGVRDVGVVGAGDAVGDTDWASTVQSYIPAAAGLAQAYIATKSTAKDDAAKVDACVKADQAAITALAEALYADSIAKKDSSPAYAAKAQAAKTYAEGAMLTMSQTATGISADASKKRIEALQGLSKKYSDASMKAASEATASKDAAKADAAAHANFYAQAAQLALKAAMSPTMPATGPASGAAPGPVPGAVAPSTGMPTWGWVAIGGVVVTGGLVTWLKLRK